MHIRLISDIHQEFFPKGYIFKCAPLPADHESILVLAGDVDIGAGAIAMLEHAATQFKAVVYVLGNHEFYGNCINVLERHAQQALGHLSNVHLLIGDSVEIAGVRFWGHTLWSDVCSSLDAYEINIVKRSMTDYRVIKRLNTSTGRTVKFDPVTQTYYFKEILNKLEIFLKENPTGKNVIVTHHAPSFKSIADRFIGSTLNYAYATNLDALITKSNIALWCHGHMHDSADYIIGDTRVVLNPYGYHGIETNKEYDKFKCIEI